MIEARGKLNRRGSRLNRYIHIHIHIYIYICCLYIIISCIYIYYLWLLLLLCDMAICCCCCWFFSVAIPRCCFGAQSGRPASGRSTSTSHSSSGPGSAPLDPGCPECDGGEHFVDWFKGKSPGNPWVFTIKLMGFPVKIFPSSNSMTYTLCILYPLVN